MFISVPPTIMLTLYTSSLILLLFHPMQEVKYALMHHVLGVGCGDIVRTVNQEGQVKVGGTLGHCHVRVEATQSNQAIARHVVVDRVALLVTTPRRPNETVVCRLASFPSSPHQ
jgi:hypothetical protein